MMVNKKVNRENIAIDCNSISIKYTYNTGTHKHIVFVPSIRVCSFCGESCSICPRYTKFDNELDIL